MSSGTGKSSFARLQRNAIKEVLGGIQKKDRELRGKAARYIEKKVRAKISDEYFTGKHSIPGEPPGKITGNLLKGLTVRNGAWTSLVGFVKPGFHAILLEFGAGRRTHWKNSSLPNPMAARPFLFPTFAEERGAVIDILSEKRV
jgi:hypothetical protein